MSPPVFTSLDNVEMSKVNSETQDNVFNCEPLEDPTIINPFQKEGIKA